MKRNCIVSFCFSAICLLFASCEKTTDRGLIELAFESYSGSTKVAVEHCEASWVERETIRINGTEAGVEYVGGVPMLRVPSQPINRAVYPTSLTDASLTDDEVTLTFPSTYHYRVDNTLGRQLLEAPLAARTMDGDALEFKHLTAALSVAITNSEASKPLSLESITVTSDAYQLCGSRTIHLDNIGSIAAATSNTAAERTVELLFDQFCDLPAGEKAYFMIPILPVGTDNHFTVTIVYHYQGTRYTYTRVQGTSEADRSIARNELAYAPVSLAAATGSNTTSSSLFTRQAGKNQVFTPQDFVLMVQALNEGWGNYRSETFSIAEDLDMAGHAIKPIRGDLFTNLIEFNGKTISNLTIESEVISSQYRCGLFYDKLRGDVDGLCLDNLVLRHTSTESGGTLCVGGLCSNARGAITINNCTVNIASVQMEGFSPAQIQFGALIGRSERDVSSSAPPPQINVQNSTISVNADITCTGALFAGGIIGVKSSSSSSTIGNIYTTGSSIGGTIRITHPETSSRNIGKYIGKLSGNGYIGTCSNTLEFYLNGTLMDNVPDKN